MVVLKIIATRSGFSTAGSSTTGSSAAGSSATGSSATGGSAAGAQAANTLTNKTNIINKLIFFMVSPQNWVI
jgi:hypothetical protein